MDKLNEFKELIIKSVAELDEEEVLELAAGVLEKGMDPLSLLEIVNEGMQRVGKLYENRDYYIADLIMAGIIFREVLQLEKMVAHFQQNHNKKVGTVLLGTVQGDIHDIGKDIFKAMLETNKFNVVDLGVDVPKEVFVEKVIEVQPDILGLSGALTPTIESMKEVVMALQEEGIRKQVKVILGANHMTPEICEYIKADGFSNDASIGVKVCQEWIQCKHVKE